METPIKIQLVKSLSNLKPSRIIAVKKDLEPDFSLYITDINGVPYPIKSSGVNTGISSIVNTDGNIDVIGTSDIVINIDSALLTVINSALQSGSNISELINDQGYITTSALPTNTSELINNGSDNTSTYVENDELATVAFSNNFLDLNNIPVSFPPSSHTHVEADITDLDKYGQSEVNGFLAGKEDLINKKTDIDANKTSNVFYASIKAIYDWGVGLFQPLLISGSNIKTINGSSLLGAGDLIVSGGGVEKYIIKDQLVATDVATNYYFRVNSSNSNYTPTATSGTSPDFTTCLGQINAYRYVDSFTLPYDVKLNKIIVIINNEFTYSFTLSFGYHLKNDATNSVSNPTSILEASITKGSFRRFYREYNSTDFGNVTIPANHSLITGWFFSGRFIQVYFEVEKI